MSAVPEANPVVTPVEAPAPQGSPDKATTQEAPAEQPQVKSFFSSKKAEKVQEQLPDLSKLPPEMQNVYKSFQGDYTRKTQELSEMRKAWEAERESEKSAFKAEREALQRSQEAILEAIRGRDPNVQSAGPTDVKSQIQALRAEGRYDEADALVLDYVKNAAEESVAPIKRDAETAKLTSTFNATAFDVVSRNPVVAEYKDEVVRIFDAPTQQMQAIRAVALSSPANVQTFVPMILNAIATEIHARTLEADRESLRAELNALKSKTTVAKARSIPPSLVSSGGRSRETNGGGGGLAGALARATEKLAGG